MPFPILANWALITLSILVGMLVIATEGVTKRVIDKGRLLYRYRSRFNNDGRNRL